MRYLIKEDKKMVIYVLIVLVLVAYIFFDGIRDKRVDQKLKDQDRKIEDLEEKLKYILDEIGKEDFK